MAIETPAGSLGGQPLVSCSTTIRNFSELGLDYSPFYQRANSYTCSLGAEPGIGWVLMQAGNLALLNSALPQDLVFGLGRKTITFKNLAILRSQRVLESDGQSLNGLHLVQLADVRYFLKRTRINKRYNLRKYGTESEWIDGTLRTAGTPWTFSQIAEDIWGNFSSFGSFFSGFSSWSGSNIYGTLPTNDPENLRFEEMSALDALQIVCQENGFYLRYNPTTAGISIIKVGYAPDPNPGTEGWMQFGFGGSKTSSNAIGFLPTNNTTLSASGPATVRGNFDGLEMDTESAIGIPYIPTSVRVVFQTNGNDEGNISDINSNTGRGWHYSVEKTAATIRSSALTDSVYSALDTSTDGTVVTLYSNTFAQFANATSIIPTNLTVLGQIATRIATDYYRTLIANCSARVIYSGLINIIPGPIVTQAIWHEYGDGMKSEFSKSPIPVGLPEVDILFESPSEEEPWRPKRAIPVTSLQDSRR